MRFLPKDPQISRRMVAVAWGIVVGLVVAIFLWLILTVADQAADQRHTDTTITELKDNDAAQEAALEEANRRLTEAGEQPVVTPPPVTGPSSDEIRTSVEVWFATHDLALTPGYATSMQAAVTRYLIANPPPAGADGKNGRPPTEREIAAQVASYVSAHPPADGRDGVDGTDGQDGIDGENGSNGVDGQDGADGRGIATSSINADGHLVLTYTDGASDDLGRVVGRDGVDGQDGQSAFPFTFSWTVQENPAHSTTYTVTCTADGCSTTQQ